LHGWCGSRGFLGSDVWRGARLDCHDAVAFAQISGVGVEFANASADGLDECGELGGVVNVRPGKRPRENGLGFGMDQDVDFEPVAAFPLLGFGSTPTSLVPRDRETGSVDADVKLVFFRRSERARFSLPRKASVKVSAWR
jgi:hypothetical protein